MSDLPCVFNTPMHICKSAIGSEGDAMPCSFIDLSVFFWP